MAEDLPDAPWAKKEELPDAPWATDPGFWAGAGRAARGVATGVESTVDELGSRIPGFIGPHDPELVKKTLKEREAPKDFPEKAGSAIGEVLPTFALPGFGLDALAVRGLRLARGLRGAQLTQFPKTKGLASALERIAGSTIEGGARGAAGGALIPGDDTAENAAIGAGIGIAGQGAGTIAQSAMIALPPKIKNTLSAIAAMAAANKVGIPWWTAFMHPNWQQGSIFQQLYNANLADLAAKYFRKATNVNPAVAGASGVELKERSK